MRGEWQFPPTLKGIGYPCHIFMTNKQELKKLDIEIRKLERKQSKKMTPLQTKRNILIDKIVDEQNKKVFGNCYKTKNHYGDPSDSWWMYMKVVGQADNELVVLTMQEPSYPELEIQLKSIYPNRVTDNDMKPISKAEFRKVYGKIIKKVEEGVEL